MDEILVYNGENITFQMLNKDVMINLTEVAKAFPRKNLTTIINSVEIQDYIKALSKLKNVSLADILIVKRGGVENGTWANSKLALRVAQKLSTDFAILVDTKIEEILTGKAKPLSQAEITLRIAQTSVEHEQRINKLEEKINLIEAKTTTRPDYFTIAGYGSLNKISVSRTMAAKLGKEASKICKQKGIMVDEVPDPRFGRVGSYLQNILHEIFVSEFTISIT